MKYLPVLFCLLFLISCEKENDPDTPATYIKATINGTDWESSSVETMTTHSDWMAFISDKIVLWLYDTVPAQFNFREQSVTALNLLKYDAGKTESDLWLSWQTAQETNNKFFIIEKAQNIGPVTPNNWSAVDTILSAGPGDHAYEYLYKITGCNYNGQFRCKYKNL